MAHGAREIYACATHGILSGPAIERLRESPIEKLVITDTVPLSPDKRISKIEVLSVAPMLAEGIRRIHGDQSLSSIFERFWFQETR